LDYDQFKVLTIKNGCNLNDPWYQGRHLIQAQGNARWTNVKGIHSPGPNSVSQSQRAQLNLQWWLALL